MSGSNRIVDARGLPCPQPVVMTKKALEENADAAVEVIVDNDAARENVLRFATYSGRRAEASPGEGGSTRIEIFAAAGGAPSGAPEDAPGIEVPRAPSAAPVEPSGGAPARVGPGKIILLASDGIGAGSDELGALLARGFLYALAEGDAAPSRIILMNSGVKLALEGSDSLASLKKLAEAGVDVLACGTCLDFFGVKAKLAVGRVTNMYEIAQLLSTEPALRL